MRMLLALFVFLVTRLFDDSDSNSDSGASDSGNSNSGDSSTGSGESSTSSAQSGPLVDLASSVSSGGDGPDQQGSSYYSSDTSDSGGTDQSQPRPRAFRRQATPDQPASDADLQDIPPE